MGEKMRNTFREDRDDILAREIIKETTGEADSETTLAYEFLKELDMRLEQVKVYYPFMEILRKRKEQDFAELVPELCILVMSYLIYEGKLKHRGISYEQLELFLGKTVKIIMPQIADQIGTGALTGDILDSLQNGGKNFALTVYSFKTGGYKEKYIKLIEIKQSDDGKLLYHITDHGVDFYLKTKEFPEETKITMNLLLFQKQMEKGAFGFAYETVRRLNMEVQKKKDRKYSLLEALMYGQLDSGEAYNEYHRSIVLQFEEESELFNSAMINVSEAYGEYIERIQNGEADVKEQRAFMLIKIIEKEIGRAQTLHTELLREAIGFTKEYDKALAVRRKAIFTERFNFMGEFDKVLENNEKPETLKYFFEPLLRPKVPKSFNPLRAFEPQRVLRMRQDEQTGPEDESSADRDTLDDITRLRVRSSFVFYATELLRSIWDQQFSGDQQSSKDQQSSESQQLKISLQDFSRHLVERYSQDILYNGDFLSFILEMNREKEPGSQTRIISFDSGQLNMDAELKTIAEVFIKAAQNVRSGEPREPREPRELGEPGEAGRIGRITVQSFPDEEVELLPGLKITNMLFTGEVR